MDVPHIGPVTRDEQLGWLYSGALTIKALGGHECRILLEGYESDSHQEDFHEAIANFLSIDRTPFTNAAPHIFHYYQDCAPEPEFQDELDEYPEIRTPDDIWDHIDLDTEPLVSRRANGDKSVYISLECNCDWEVEHGLQIVLKKGLVVNKVGPYDSHLTNSYAFDDGSLEEVIYHSSRS